RTGNILHPVQHLLCETAVALTVRPDDLNIDRRREAEVQYLRHHVDGEFIKNYARETVRKNGAQFLHISFCGMMIFRQRYLDIGIGRTDGSRVAVGSVDTAIGQADVIDNRGDFLLRNHFADRPVHLIADSSGLFDTSAGAGAHVQLELPGIDRGKEILPQEGIEHHRRPDTENEEEGEEDGGMFQAHLQEAAITKTKLLEEMLEALLEAHQRIAAFLLLLVCALVV